MTTINEWIAETMPYDPGPCMPYYYETPDGTYFGLIDVPMGVRKGFYPNWKYLISDYNIECNGFTIYVGADDKTLPKNWFFT